VQNSRKILHGSYAFTHISRANGTETCVNIYDYTLTDTYPSCGMGWPPHLQDYYAYMKRKDVVTALHAEGKHKLWEECDHRVLKALNHNHSKSSHIFIPDLANRIKVLYFSGDHDLICNVLGTERSLAQMKWNGATGFGDAKPQKWFVGDKQVGTNQTARNITFLTIFNGTHMVSVDKNKETFDMINRFMGIDLGSKLQSWIGDTKPIPPTTTISLEPTTSAEVEKIHASMPSDSGDILLKDNYFAGYMVLLFVLLGGLVTALYIQKRVARRRRNESNALFEFLAQDDSMDDDDDDFEETEMYLFWWVVMCVGIICDLIDVCLTMMRMRISKLGNVCVLKEQKTLCLSHWSW
jgi:carboxypeptidase D